VRKAFHKAVLAAILVTAGGFSDVVAAQVPAQTEWSDITQVVVRAHIPGPVIWKVTKGNATVWVLGVMDLKPEPLEWNSAHFQRVLRGSKALILMQESSWEPTNSMLPKTVHLKDVLSAPIYARLEHTIMREGFTVPTYDRYRPVWAGARLMGDIIDDHSISSRLLPANIYGMAQAAGVPIQPLLRDVAPTLLDLYDRLDKAGNEACLVDYLDSIDYLLGVMPKVTSAWARGDLKTIMRYHQQMAYTSCILSDPATAPLYPSYAIDNVVSAIDTALQSPGKTVAVWPLSDLLRKGGVMDKLRAEGAEISAPVK
jgi:uncharacterized protein YbaP (TraB family)